MERISAVVPTLNEAGNISDCLRSLRWVDELVVVDSYSDDGTVELAREIADRVELRRFDGFSRQKNYCIRTASNKWVLLVDADERVTDGLREEISRVLERPKRQGYWIKRSNHFLGRRMRGGGWGRDWVLRLFERDAGHYPDKLVHEQLLLQGQAGRLGAPLLHYPYRSLEEYWRKFHRYSRLSAEELRRQGRRGGLVPILLRPPARFLRMYLLQMGFVDGQHGLLLAGLSAFQVFAKYTRLWELWREAKDPPRGLGRELERW